MPNPNRAAYAVTMPLMSAFETGLSIPVMPVLSLLEYEPRCSRSAGVQRPYARYKTSPRRGMPGVGPAIQLMQEPFERTIDSAARQVLRARDLVLQHGN